MTEEEYFRKTYPDSCYGGRPLSPYFDFFQDGVEFGERQSEKKIAELKETLAQTIENDEVAYETLKLHDQEEIGMLKAQIENMKCCWNCYWNRNCTSKKGKACEEWEIKEIEK